MPTPYKRYTQAQWQQILQRATHAHDQLAVKDAVAALNQYDKDAVPPTTGELLGAEAKGVAQFPGQALHGIGSTLDQIGHGDISGAVNSTLTGLGKGIQGLTKLPAAAANYAGASMSGEPAPDYSKDELLGRAKNYGSSEGALAALAAPGAISRFGKGTSEGGVGAGLSAAVRGMPEPTGLVPGYQPTAGSVGRAPADATVAPKAAAPSSPQPLTDAARNMSDEELAAQPHGQTPPVEASGAAPGALDQALAKLNPLGKPKPSGFPPFEENAELPGMPKSDPSGLLGNEHGWSTPETMAMMVALGTRLGSGAGILKALSRIPFGKVAADVTGTAATGAALSPNDSTGGIR